MMYQTSWSHAKQRVGITATHILFLFSLLFVPASFAAQNGQSQSMTHSGAGSDAWTGDVTPITAQDWNRDRAAHLLERAGFGGTPQEIDRLTAMTPKEAVEWLVNYQEVDNSHIAPFDESGIFDPPVEPFPKSRADAVRIARATGQAMGVKVKPGGDRPLQPVVDRFFYWLRANRLGRLAGWTVVGRADADHEPAA